jgi:hypothetical protein
MRSIRVSTDVFARIWSLREEGESTEDAVLRRLLLGEAGGQVEHQPSGRPPMGDRIRWVDDVFSALRELGGQAALPHIYSRVRDIRLANGRSVPTSFEEVIRKEIEVHSSDSEAFQGREDYFYAPHGKGAGVWGIR